MAPLWHHVAPTQATMCHVVPAVALTDPWRSSTTRDGLPDEARGADRLAARPVLARRRRREHPDQVGAYRFDDPARRGRHRDHAGPHRGRAAAAGAAELPRGAAGRGRGRARHDHGALGARVALGVRRLRRPGRDAGAGGGDRSPAGTRAELESNTGPAWSARDRPSGAAAAAPPAGGTASSTAVRPWTGRDGTVVEAGALVLTVRRWLDGPEPATAGARTPAGTWAGTESPGAARHRPPGLSPARRAADARAGESRPAGPRGPPTAGPRTPVGQAAGGSGVRRWRKARIAAPARRARRRRRPPTARAGRRRAARSRPGRPPAAACRPAAAGRVSALAFAIA